MMLRNLGKDVALYGLVDFAFRIVGFIVFPLYAHALRVDEFGVLTLVGTTVGLVALLANAGVNNAVQRFYWEPGNEPGRQREIVTTGLALLITTGAVAIGVALLTAALLGRTLQGRYGVELTVITVALLGLLPDQILQYALDAVRLRFSPWRFVVISALRNLLATTLSLWLVLGAKLGVLGFFLGALLAGLLSLPPALALIRRDLGGAPSIRHAQQLWRFGYPFIFAGFGYWLLTSLDRWMVAALSDGTQLGLYGIAAKFASAVFFLNAAFGQAWTPFAMKARRDRDDYREVYATVGAGWFFLIAWAGCTLAALAPELLSLLTPPEYHAAASSMAVLAIGSVLFGTTQITALGISIAARTHLFVRATWAVAGLNFALNLVLIPLFGATGAAIGTTVSYAALTALYLYWSQQLHPLPLRNSKFVFSLACCCAALALANLPSGAASLTVKAILLACMPWLAIRLRVLDWSELKGATPAPGPVS